MTRGEYEAYQRGRSDALMEIVNVILNRKRFSGEDAREKRNEGITDNRDAEKGV